jgi:hypothetical protein
VFGEGHHDSVVQRGIDEALACQDTLARTPVKPSLLAQAVAWIVAAAPWARAHQPVSKRGAIHPVVTPPVTNSTLMR